MQNSDNFRRGTVELAVLCVLLDGEMYGYEIVQKIEERSGGLFKLPLGTLYPVLYRFTESGFITDRDEIVGKRLRKYYKLTDTGKEYYAALLDDYKRVVKGVELLTEGANGNDSP